MSTPVSKGFTILELMVVLFLIGLLITMVAPRFSRRASSSEWKNIHSDLNSLAQFALQESIADQKVYRLRFKKGKKNQSDIVLVERQESPENHEGKIEFAQVVSAYLSTSYSLAPEVRIKAVYLGKQDLFNDSADVACHVVPEGLFQAIYVQLVRTEKDVEEFATYKMLPFVGQFELIEKLVRPDQEG